MKKLSLILVFLVFGNFFLFAQVKPPITVKDLEKNTYYFEIIDDQLIGDGAKFLTTEFNQNQYILLGEYHGSFQISKFTKAIIPILDNSGFKTFGLEVGPISVELLSDLSKESAQTTANLNKFNSQNYVATKSQVFTPIPFFNNVEDAEFLAEAKKRKWNLIGLDQEFSYRHKPLVRQMYKNLNNKRKAELKSLLEQVVMQLKLIYELDDKDREKNNMYQAIIDSKEVNSFLDSASKSNSKNKRIAEQIKITSEIYNLNRNRKWFDNCQTPVENMKKNLTEEFSRLKFNLSKDKMLLKMGGAHTGRGFGSLSLFEIGNTLSELAKFNKNKSLHINFNSRYYIENGKEIDSLADPKAYSYRFQALLQMAKKDKWTVIDLRPMIPKVFWDKRYNVDEVILELLKQYDLYILPPTDIDPKQNFITK